MNKGDKKGKTMNREICFLDVVKDDNGFWNCGQSLYIAYLRSLLKVNDISSMIFIEDTLPSLADLSEEILSTAGDIIVFYARKDNWELVFPLVRYIQNMEEITLILIGEKIERLQTLNTLYFTEKPEIQLLLELGITANDVDIFTVSPYKTGILSPYDAKAYGVLIGETGQGGINRYRQLKYVEEDCKTIAESLSQTSKVYKITLSSFYLNDQEYMYKLLEALETIKIDEIVYIIKIDSKLLFQIDKMYDKVQNIIFDIKVGDLKDIQMEELNHLAEGHLINEITTNIETVLKSEQFEKFLNNGEERKIFTCRLYGDINFSKMDKQQRQEPFIKRSLKKCYTPFSRGFLRSRTGMYNGIFLDRYVKHIEIEDENFNERIASYLNEIACINSSIIIRGAKARINDEKGYFDSSSNGRILNTTYELYREKMLNAGAVPSNIITRDENIRINDLYYMPKSNLVEAHYADIKKMILEKAKPDRENIYYTYSISQLKDFNVFLEDAESFYNQHKLIDSPLEYGNIQNNCMFMNYKCCYVDKIPRVYISGDENIYICSDYSEPLGKVGQAAFELAQNSYVRKERMIKDRGCAECPSKSWCAKCTHLPEILKNNYCDIMRNKPYVADYIMASEILLQLITTSPKFMHTDMSDFTVSSEYMFNFSEDVKKGEENPFFPKYTYLYECNGEYVFWSSVKSTFTVVSKEIACVLELLLRCLSPFQIYEEYGRIMHVLKDESEKVCKYVFEKFNKAGVLYRLIKE